MPGSPTQKFTQNPILSGIGGFSQMYSMLNPAEGKGATQSLIDMIRGA